ncbi:MAG: pyridoxal phosphate-dependent aminotransferase [Lachnospiraceae bacterium]|nr:pyridoxal phosphate-dependent aminotransferase [Lachnospiraceae bacterium]
MINENYKAMLGKKSVIRQLSEFATERGKEIGYDNVFDFSLGNPSVAAPEEFNNAMKALMDEKTAMELHGYSPTLGNPEFKKAVADSLNRRFGMTYKPSDIFPTSGAAGAIAHALRAVTVPGDEVMVFAPFFPEYIPYVTGTGAKITVVPADTKAFQINFEKFDKLLNPNVKAVLINTPNNPTGVVYSEETIKKLAAKLEEKSAEYGFNIYLISDEPYREIIFDGVDNPYPAKYYKYTLTCYSFSKSLSLPGERIGYVACNPADPDSETIVAMCGQISRGTGHNCPASIIQQACAQVIDMTSDLSVYEKNMNLLYDELVKLGFEVVKPGGTFYIFPKALEDDAVAFSQKALKYDLVLVPADSFDCPGYFRMAYCIETEKVERSLANLRKFVETEYPNR